MKAETQVIPELHKVIDTMKKKVEEIPILQQKVATMTEELSALQQNMKTAPPNTSQGTRKSYAKSVGRNSRNCKPGDAKAVTTIPASVASNATKSTSASTQKVKVSGARRIWGTMRKVQHPLQ